MRRRSPKLLLSGGIKHLTLGARFVGRRGAGSSGYSATSWESGSTESYSRRFVSIVTGAGAYLAGAPADARIARECGVDGVIVSNHGGRQLDGTVSSLRTLPEIAAEANGMTVMLDGGIRRGTDVLKALALGAKFVFVGRPLLFAAVAGGEAGVQRALTLLGDEVERDMALLGIRSICEISSGLVRRTYPFSSVRVLADPK